MSFKIEIWYAKIRFLEGNLAVQIQKKQQNRCFLDLSAKLNHIVRVGIKSGYALCVRGSEPKFLIRAVSLRRTTHDGRDDGDTHAYFCMCGIKRERFLRSRSV